MSDPSLLTIVVALPCEAKPLLSAYQLKKHYDCRAFPVYSNQTTGINLCVSGLGKVRMAACVGFIQQYLPATCMLNLGIAGSGAAALGQVFMAEKIIEAASKRSYYPAINLIKGVESLALYTHDQAVTDYPDHAMVDMEASGFFSSGMLFAAQELLQVVKVISDTNQAEQQNINPQTVTKLIESSLGQFDKVIQAQLMLARSEFKSQALPINLSEFTAHWHFTQYQRNELATLLQRWQVINADESAYQAVNAATNAKQVLQQLKTRLDQVDYVW